ncbi:hypothetical protein [Lentzea nigeriaca]|uniref:hypothetical protein n=1 Tax=Lentzea nigeriaca TaxID=1128665 RepID=UPI00195C90A6|nr:hypothetical protein [Lentzea nigeriaca]MBM7860408.1 hypothetical protein [Lentzea nigeriaca]
MNYLKPVQVSPSGCKPADEQAQDLLQALRGVELGDYDRRIVQWLAGWDAAVVETVVSLIYRARQAGPIPEG